MLLHCTRSRIVVLLTSANLTMLCGCAGTVRSLTQSAADKNLDMSGYVMLGKLETASPETALPTGQLIIGQLTYKSRRIAVPADCKVPTTGSFRFIHRQSLLGTVENSLEYDFTAGSADEAAIAIRGLESQRNSLLEQPEISSLTAPDSACKLNNSLPLTEK